ncbi:SAM-dependent methlyltransferase [Roseivivax halodurans JCM 10272]|uniref:Magnesium protoporphyrin IX methyltransferase n=1 Tax=Roseivivax halodurans JCM 10272 TaxID=1449350 RepID=X7EGF1_9RHOB|nr:magnesium protoporphyrin IX methyltransferase [Roseivivax halodurans]ETX14992.1 SAM-dependent methlyltransferase [Roseivivax halodurans JCM 10272]
MSYEATRSRVEDYFDRTATETWARLTSDAPVSRIRATVRAGRDAMRERLLAALPGDLVGARVLDAGCGAGQMSQALAERGAEVVAVDLSPQLVSVAEARMPEALTARVTFAAGDMTDPALGRFDHVIAMDSLIYYREGDIAARLHSLMQHTRRSAVFTVAPRTRALMAMWYAGKLFPRSDRSPVMVPHVPERLAAVLGGEVRDLGRVTSGFYISHALELRG